MHNPNQDLAELLRAHDIAVEASDNWLVPSGKGQPLRAFVEHQTSRESSEVVRLDVQCALEDGRLLIEGFAGTGTDLDSAYQNAFQNFSSSTLHVLLAAFFGQPCEDQYASEVWSAPRGQWRVFLGNATLRATKAAEEELKGSSPQIPEELVPAIQGAVEEHCSADGRPHWVRVFVSQLQGEFTFEGILDNARWSPLEDRLAKLPWPRGIHSYYSVRLFLLLAPEGDSQGAPPPAIPIASLEDAIHHLVETVTKNPAVDDDELFHALTNRGIEPPLARQLVTFAPVGFSTLLLANAASLPTEYTIMNEDGIPTANYPLAGEPAFNVARDVASRLAADPDQKNRFLAFAARCSMVNAANQALEAGSQLEDLAFTPLAVFNLEPSSPPLSASGPVPTGDGQHSEHRGRRGLGGPPETKPWWQFWRRRPKQQS